MQRGEQIDRFVLRRYLGRGGMGDVWLAEDPERDIAVALKLIRCDFIDGEALEAERRGAALQQQLHRFVPEVAEVYDFADRGEFFLIAMEYVDGTELAALLRQGALPESEALAIAVQLCRILEKIQAASAEITGARGGVVHGDIKPENIRLQERNRVRLLDFGVAKSLSATRGFTSNMFGSTAFLSPERLAQGVVTLQSDLWAVGVVLYQMVTGRLPFVAEAVEALEARILSRQPPVRPSCSPLLQQILLRCLAADPEQRYPTPAALRADLEAVQAGRPLSPWPRTGRSRETRRTSGLPPEPTRRTQASPGVVRIRTHDHTEEGTAPSRPGAGRWGARIALLLAVPLLLLLMGSQVSVWLGFGQIQQELAAAPAEEVEALWLRYRDLSRWSLFGSGAAEAAMREALTRAAEPILTGYSGDDPRSRREDWERTARLSAAVLELGPANPADLARLSYCRGNLTLSVLKELKDEGAAEDALRFRQGEALNEFRQAAEQDESWVQPYLGLARIYAYHRSDLPKLQQTLAEAAQRGADRRLVTALLADGHLAEGRNLYRQSLKVRGSEGEPDVVRAAVRHLERAEALYAEISGYAQVERNRAEAARRRETAENRLATLEEW